MLLAGGHLLMVEIKLGFVGALDRAHGVSACSIHCLTHAWIWAARRLALRRP
jgi:hypothetical protein